MKMISDLYGQYAIRADKIVNIFVEPGSREPNFKVVFNDGIGNRTYRFCKTNEEVTQAVQDLRKEIELATLVFDIEGALKDAIVAAIISTRDELKTQGEDLVGALTRVTDAIGRRNEYS